MLSGNRELQLKNDYVRKGDGLKRPNSETARSDTAYLQNGKSKTAHFTKTAHYYRYKNGLLFIYDPDPMFTFNSHLVLFKHIYYHIFYNV